MTAKHFWDFIHTLEADAEALSVRKSADYATADVLSNFKRMAALWSAFLGTPVPPWRIAVMLVLMKIDRLKNLEGREPQNEGVLDSCRDWINYTRLAIALLQESIDAVHPAP